MKQLLTVVVIFLLCTVSRAQDGTPILLLEGAPGKHYFVLTGEAADYPFPIDGLQTYQKWQDHHFIDTVYYENDSLCISMNGDSIPPVCTYIPPSGGGSSGYRYFIQAFGGAVTPIDSGEVVIFKATGDLEVTRDGDTILYSYVDLDKDSTNELQTISQVNDGNGCDTIFLSQDSFVVVCDTSHGDWDFIHLLNDSVYVKTDSLLPLRDTSLELLLYRPGPIRLGDTLSPEPLDSSLQDILFRRDSLLPALQINGKYIALDLWNIDSTYLSIRNNKSDWIFGIENDSAQTPKDSIPTRLVIGVNAYDSTDLISDVDTNFRVPFILKSFARDSAIVFEKGYFHMHDYRDSSNYDSSANRFAAFDSLGNLRWNSIIIDSFYHDNGIEVVPIAANGDTLVSTDHDWYESLTLRPPLHIDSAVFTNNYVGINTNDPQYELDIHDWGPDFSGVTYIHVFSENATAGIQLENDHGTTYINNHAGGAFQLTSYSDIYLGSSGTQVFTIDSAAMAGQTLQLKVDTIRSAVYDDTRDDNISPGQIQRLFMADDDGNFLLAEIDSLSDAIGGGYSLPSLDENHITFISGGDLATDLNGLIWNAANNQLGIGGSPFADITIQDAVTANMYFESLGYVFNTSVGPLSGANFLANTPSNTATFAIGLATAGGSASMNFQSNSSEYNAYVDADEAYLNLENAAYGDNFTIAATTDGFLDIYGDNSGAVSIVDNAPTNALVVESDGVGVGTATPGYDLHVYDDASFADIAIETTQDQAASFRLINSGITWNFEGRNSAGFGAVRIRDETNGYDALQIYTDGGQFEIGANQIDMVSNKSGVNAVFFDAVNEDTIGMRTTGNMEFLIRQSNTVEFNGAGAIDLVQFLGNIPVSGEQGIFRYEGRDAFIQMTGADLAWQFGTSPLTTGGNAYVEFTDAGVWMYGYGNGTYDSGTFTRVVGANSNNDLVALDSATLASWLGVGSGGADELGTSFTNNYIVVGDGTPSGKEVADFYFDGSDFVIGSVASIVANGSGGSLLLSTSTEDTEIYSDRSGGFNRMIIRPAGGNQAMSAFYSPSGTNDQALIQVNNSDDLSNRGRFIMDLHGAVATFYTDVVGSGTEPTSLTIAIGAGDNEIVVTENTVQINQTLDVTGTVYLEGLVDYAEDAGSNGDFMVRDATGPRWVAPNSLDFSAIDLGLTEDAIPFGGAFGDIDEDPSNLYYDEATNGVHSDRFYSDVGYINTFGANGGGFYNEGSGAHALRWWTNNSNQYYDAEGADFSIVYRSVADANVFTINTSNGNLGTGAITVGDYTGRTSTALTGFTSAGVLQQVTDGSGLDISGSNALVFNLSEVSTIGANGSDYVLVHDVSDGGNMKKVLMSTVAATGLWDDTPGYTYLTSGDNVLIGNSSSDVYGDLTINRDGNVDLELVAGGDGSWSAVHFLNEGKGGATDEWIATIIGTHNATTNDGNFTVTVYDDVNDQQTVFDAFADGDTYVLSQDFIYFQGGTGDDYMQIVTTASEATIGHENGNRIRFRDDNLIWVNQDFGVARVPTTYEFEVQGDAGKTAAGSSWNIISDKRVKKNISYIDGLDALDVISQLKPSSFEYKKFYIDDGMGKEGTFYNFIAQDYEQVFPDQVSEIAGYKSLSIDAAQMNLFAAVQQLIKENEELKKRIEKLEN